MRYQAALHSVRRSATVPSWPCPYWRSSPPLGRSSRHGRERTLASRSRPGWPARRIRAGLHPRMADWIARPASTVVARVQQLQRLCKCRPTDPRIHRTGAAGDTTVESTRGPSWNSIRRPARTRVRCASRCVVALPIAEIVENVMETRRRPQGQRSSSPCPWSSAVTTAAASARVTRDFCSRAARSSWSTTRPAVDSERSMREMR